jgi:hypothetical protein
MQAGSAGNKVQHVGARRASLLNLPAEPACPARIARASFLGATLSLDEQRKGRDFNCSPCLSWYKNPEEPFFAGLVKPEEIVGFRASTQLNAKLKICRETCTHGQSLLLTVSK